MPKYTTNYNLKKPLYAENADVAVLNENMDIIDGALTPFINQALEPGTETSGKIADVIGWFANRIKAIIGLNSWRDTPPVTLKECSDHITGGRHTNANSNADGFMSSADKTKLDGATSSYTSGKLMMRDSDGRAQVQNPSSSYDIANKTYVDSNFVKKNADTTMTAKLIAQSNTAYTTKQIRNIVLWTSGSTPPASSYGDIVIKVC